MADITVAPDLTAGIAADSAIADKGYDSQEFVDALEANGIEAVIPPRKNRKRQRHYDKYLYRLRHVVENSIQQLNAWRGLSLGCFEVQVQCGVRFEEGRQSGTVDCEKLHSILWSCRDKSG